MFGISSTIVSIISIIEVVIVLVPTLLGVAYVTVAERKTMASMQRRLGPNIVGYYGLLQAFADALKLLLKEYVAPTQSNIILFFLGPVITLIFALLGYGVIPYGPGLTISDMSLGIFYMLAVSSLATYGILLAGWSANSKYAFLGSLRSTAQLISYELVLSSAILLVIMLTGSLNLTENIEVQRTVWFIFPLLIIFIIFFIGSIAETNRAPFDLAEAESELVSGFMTEHAAVVFVFFFLAEYGSIVLMCILTSILFLGGYLLINNLDLFNSIFLDLSSISIFVKKDLNEFVRFIFFIYQGAVGSTLIVSIYDYIMEGLKYEILYYNNILIEGLYYYYFDIIKNSSVIDGLLYGLVLGLKSSILIFIFIWTRASFPRIRFDQLMAFCWTVLLPILFALIILIPCILYTYSIFPINIYLL
jgi:NADH-ubiquinone oxidoreductase chain 1